MKINYKKDEIFHYNYLKIIKYNDENFKVMQFKHRVRKSGFETDKIIDFEFDEPELSSEENNDNDEYLRQSISRTKRVVHDYALCNEFDYFITLTFDRKKYDSSDIKLLKSKVGQWLNNYKKRVNPELKYLLIPELHSDKKHFHFHGLISGINDITEFRESKKGIMRYNWDSWQNKFGFSSLESVRDTLSVSRYITKYITKDLIIEFNKQRYLVSKGLKKPGIFFEIDNYTEEIRCDFENEYIRILNINSYDEIYMYLCLISNMIGGETYVVKKRNRRV